MHVADDYRISELKVQERDWIADKTLRESGVRDDGLVVLGIEKTDGTYLGAPQPETEIKPDDRLVIYGRGEKLESLDSRKRDSAGDADHGRAVREQRQSADAREALRPRGNKDERRSLNPNGAAS